MDRSYRYKMPKLVAKVEGRGNGIKTRIVNCGEIAQALHRKPAVVTKFFGCELGAQSRWDDKEQASIVNGAFEQNILQDKLCESFLPKFVLCANCGLPETSLKVKKEVVKFECAACGDARNADMGHKLITFILADAKKEKDAKKAEKKSEKKDGDKAEKKSDKSGDKEEKKEKKKDKDKEKSKDKEGKKKDKKKKAEESDEEEWFTDVSEAAVEARRKAEMEKLGGKVVIAGGEEEVGAVAKVLEASALSNNSMVAEEEEEEEAAIGPPEEVVSSLVDSLLHALTGLKKSKEVLPATTEWGATLGEDATPVALLNMVEQLPQDNSTFPLKHTAIVLKVLYDADRISEEDILSWYEGADKEIPTVLAAQSFVDFLSQ